MKMMRELKDTNCRGEKRPGGHVQAGRWSAEHDQISDVAKKGTTFFFPVFGLRGPSTGPGTVKR